MAAKNHTPRGEEPAGAHDVRWIKVARSSRTGQVVVPTAPVRHEQSASGGTSLVQQTAGAIKSKRPVRPSSKKFIGQH